MIEITNYQKITQGSFSSLWFCCDKLRKQSVAALEFWSHSYRDAIQQKTGWGASYESEIQMLTHNGGRDQKSDVQKVQEVSAKMFKVQLCNDWSWISWRVRWKNGWSLFLLMKDPVLTCIRDHPSELRHSPNFSLSDLEEVHMQERGHMQNGKVYLSVALRKMPFIFLCSLILYDNFCYLYFVRVFKLLIVWANAFF